MYRPDVGRRAQEAPPLGDATSGDVGVIRVLVAEDMPLIRKALVALLSLERDIDVVGEVGRGDQILPGVLATDPDVAVLDIGLPGMDGLAAADLLRQHAPRCRTIILTALANPAHVLRALRVHVRGFLGKDAPAEALAAGIQEVAAGRRVIDPDLVAAALETGTSPLSARETDVLRAADEGISTNQIGARLSLSPATVRNYLSDAIAKTGTRNRIDAIRTARRAGWL